MRIFPKPFTFKGTSHSWMRNLKKLKDADDWTREPALPDGPYPTRRPLKMISCPGCKYSQCTKAHRLEVNVGFCQLTCQSCRSTNSTKLWRCFCGKQWHKCDMHVQQKQSLTVLCNISWPCRTACSRNFSAVCPEEWLEHPLGHGVCTAPDSYAGNCASVVSTTHMSHVQKHEFALRCSIAFPCDDIARVPHIEKDPIQNGAVERDGGQRRDDAMTTTEQPRSAKFLKRFAMRPGPIPTYASNSI